MNEYDHWSSFENTGNIKHYLRYRGIPANLTADEEKKQNAVSSFDKPK